MVLLSRSPSQVGDLQRGKVTRCPAGSRLSEKLIRVYAKKGRPIPNVVTRVDTPEG